MSNINTEIPVKRPSRVFKWIRRVIIGILVLAILISGSMVYIVWSAQPQTSGTINVAGLLEQVNVYRDQYGVPQIYANNEHDLFFAQGFVQAQDRLWQMEMNRRLCNGRMSELFGASTVEADKFFRSYGLRKIAEQSWGKLDKRTRDILSSYSDGVNAFIKKGKLPVEYTIMGLKPEPWSPVDTLAWGNMVAYSMSMNHEAELVWLEAISRLGPEKAQQLMGFNRKDINLELPKEIEYGKGLYGIKIVGDALPQMISNHLGSSWGSNNWVVSGQHTDTSKPFLSNDTHMTLAMPSVWYENGLHGGQFDCVGFTFPGVPMVILGHNKDIAWGVTNLDPDVQDFYIEKFDNRKNPKKYEYKGQWYDLTIVKDEIKVRGANPVPLNIYYTCHGPVLNEVFHMPDAEPLALKWSLYEGSSVFDSLAALDSAKNWEDFRNALKGWDSLCQHFVFADQKGNIGYQATGRIPIRQDGDQGVVPVPGWNGKHEWKGYIPFEKLPSSYNPAKGFFATANNRFGPDECEYPLNLDWNDPGYRAERINDILGSKDKFSLGDMKNIQKDTVSLHAKRICPYLAAVKPENELESKVLDYIKKWDYSYPTDSVPALVYNTWYRYLVINTVSDELNSASDWFKSMLPSYFQDRMAATLVEWMKDNNNVWFDNVNTPKKENRDDIVRLSFKQTIEELKKEYGNNPEKWTLSKVNTVSIAHTPFGQSGVSILEKIFNAKPIEASGSRFSISLYRAQHNLGTGLPESFGTSQRMIIDLSNWDNMQTVNLTGEDGNIFNSNREDQLPMWQKHEYHIMPFTKKAIEANTKNKLVINP